MRFLVVQQHHGARIGRLSYVTPGTCTGTGTDTGISGLNSSGATTSATALDIDGKSSANTITVDTPSALLYTLRGSVPHLTVDMVDNFTSSNGIMHYFHEHIIGSYGMTMDVPRLFGTPQSRLSFTTLHDYTKKTQLSPIHYGDKYVSISSDNQTVRIQIEKFCEWAVKTRLPWITSIADSVPVSAGVKRCRKAVDRNLFFLDELLESRNRNGIDGNEMSIAGVISGGDFEDECLKSANETAKRPVFGFVLDGDFLKPGGKKLLDTIIQELPMDQPRILLNSCSSLANVFNAVEAGCDFVDSSYPLTLTEMGYAMIPNGKKMNLWNTEFSTDTEPLMKSCKCYACSRSHSRAYLHHLLITHEMLAPILLTSHNIHQYYALFSQMRSEIAAGNFAEMKRKFLKSAAA